MYLKPISNLFVFFNLKILLIYLKKKKINRKTSTIKQNGVIIRKSN